MKTASKRNGWTLVLPLVLLHAATSAAGEAIDAIEALTAAGFSAAEQRRILAGEIVSGEVTAVSERDLSVSMAFIVKTSPDSLAGQILAGTLSSADDQLTARGNISKAGQVKDFAALHLEPGGSAVAQSYLAAESGKWNLAGDEASALRAIAGRADATAAVEQQLRTMLLARYQAYRAAGLDGIRPYDRGGNKTSNPAADLRSASAAPLLKKYFPQVQKVLVGYPQATVTGMSESFVWVNNEVDDLPTIALTHLISAPEGDQRIILQRQFYVGRSYNAEQAIAAFLPVPEGTLVIYGNHTFTDQVAGIGGASKQSIGRRVMSSTLRKAFEKQRSLAGDK